MPVNLPCPQRESQVITLPDPAAADFGVTLSEPTPDRAPGALDETITLLADGRLRLRAHRSMPMQQAAEAHRQQEDGTVHERIILTLPQPRRHGGGQASRS
jgi:NADPH:quinone reductase-like Zn-dependent oxidoreductase